jgi:hypothetical protein
MKKIKKVTKTLKINTIKFSNNSKEVVDIDGKIKNDIKWTLIYISLSFGILFLVKYLQSNFFFNKFF